MYPECLVTYKKLGVNGQTQTQCKQACAFLIMCAALSGRENTYTAFP